MSHACFDAYRFGHSCWLFSWLKIARKKITHFHGSGVLNLTQPCPQSEGRITGRIATSGSRTSSSSWSTPNYSPRNEPSPQSNRDKVTHQLGGAEKFDARHSPFPLGFRLCYLCPCCPENFSMFSIWLSTRGTHALARHCTASSRVRAQYTYLFQQVRTMFKTCSHCHSLVQSRNTAWLGRKWIDLVRQHWHVVYVNLCTDDSVLADCLEKWCIPNLKKSCIKRFICRRVCHQKLFLGMPGKFNTRGARGTRRRRDDNRTWDRFQNSRYTTWRYWTRRRQESGNNTLEDLCAHVDTNHFGLRCSA